VCREVTELRLRGGRRDIHGKNRKTKGESRRKFQQDQKGADRTAKPNRDRGKVKLADERIGNGGVSGGGGGIRPEIGWCEGTESEERRTS